jgi:hypothetical protein
MTAWAIASYYNQTPASLPRFQSFANLLNVIVMAPFVVTCSLTLASFPLPLIFMSFAL